MRVEIGAWRRSLARPADRTARHGKARTVVPVAVERLPVSRARPGRIDAADRHSGLFGNAEQRVCWRCVFLSETAVGDDAARLARAGAQRRLLERAADPLSLRHEHVEA